MDIRISFGAGVAKVRKYNTSKKRMNSNFVIYALDDDLSVRIKAKKLRIERPPKQFSRYKMIRHQAQELNPNAIKTLKSSITRYSTDGVNTVNYKVVQISLYTGFTHIIVDIGEFREK